MDNNMLLGIAGIIATLIMGAIAIWMGYNHQRKTESAKIIKEKDAHKEMVSAVTRLLSQCTTDNIPINVLEDLIRSKCREYGINFNVNNEVSAILEDINARLVESEVITPDLRDKLSTMVLDLERKREQVVPKIEDLSEKMEEVSHPINWITVILVALRTFIISLVAVSIILSLLVQLMHVTVDTSYALAPLIIAVFTALLSILPFVFPSIDNKKKREDITSDYEAYTFDNIRKVAKKLKEPKFSAHREYKIIVGDKNYIADFVIEYNGKKIPVEVKSVVHVDDIGQISNTMSRMEAQRGLIISYSTVEESMKGMARSKNIIVIDRISSEEILTRKLINEVLI
ncbi:MAG: hypothetical protein NTV42_05760 [Chloroflexi bacterium]|nr:hypothetical protein [Chloroflexota bacterium]